MISSMRWKARRAILRSVFTQYRRSSTNSGRKTASRRFPLKTNLAAQAIERHRLPFVVEGPRQGGEKAEYFLSVVLPSLPVTVVENSLEDVIAAARIKAAHALSFADCFAAATAIRESAPLVTGDPELRKLGKALEIDWIG